MTPIETPAGNIEPVVSSIVKVFSVHSGVVHDLFGNAAYVHTGATKSSTLDNCGACTIFCSSSCTCNSTWVKHKINKLQHRMHAKENQNRRKQANKENKHK